MSHLTRRLDRLERARDGAVPPHVRAAILGATDQEVLAMLAQAAEQVRDLPVWPLAEDLGPSHLGRWAHVSDEQLLAELAAAKAASGEPA